MQSKYTLLKDFLTYPAGTIFIVRGVEENKYYDTWLLQDDGCIIKLNYKLFPINSFLDNPEWVKKELDEDNLIDLKCPKCGATKGDFFNTKYYNSHYNDDDYGIQFAIGIECICGYKRILYGTHYGILKLKKEL